MTEERDYIVRWKDGDGIADKLVLAAPNPVAAARRALEYVNPAVVVLKIIVEDADAE